MGTGRWVPPRGHLVRPRGAPWPGPVVPVPGRPRAQPIGAGRRCLAGGGAQLTHAQVPQAPGNHHIACPCNATYPTQQEALPHWTAAHGNNDKRRGDRIPWDLPS